MKNHLPFVTLLLLFSLACSPGSEKGDKTSPVSPDCFKKRSQACTANQLWACCQNQQKDSLQSLYTSKALKVDSRGAVTSGFDAIRHYHSIQNFSIDSIYPIKRLAANKRYDYEIGAFHSNEGKTFTHLLIWDRQGRERRKFEFIAQNENTIPADSQIHPRRAKWIELCNMHDAKRLVEELYTPNAVYYNHKPAVIGWEAIAKEYAYMNDESYRLSLEPIVLKTVSPKLAVEIGQCQGSYNGKYILIWQKNMQEEWKILVDSNI